ncbi:NADPH-dependent ferric siderophore reductase [Curtobacterium sp. PhB130]|uniref:siderophore-interacting protein n=1 Tax=unclassified Curtobacterium TaxID=257496 RepID=UPI000F4B6FA0|nr:MULTISPECIES: siderophore-interacting protein [unclassified Curtobacterium]ROP65926.1 NADPH-dependent ferric siderophore reductase [Curtobacterium sp. ZW137]ROS74025.1 NADPH-dependent ferric siderophore reductase [Curtobacterium sp. PhB130]TCK62843.1 NADPH-dependent ferric siderophore reductase [Curtobacterium sp. PhB136]
MSSKNRTQHVFVVDRTEQLSPHMVRVHLGGPAFDDFIAAADPERLGSTDKYVKLLVAKPELGLEPPYDLEALRETLPKHDRPARRTYTVRAIDLDAHTIAIDFVVHGDEGLAGPWAAAAEPGDRLALSGPGGGYAPSTDPAVVHVLLGDDSALPAIASALEAMDDSATGVALVEVAGPDDEQDIAHPAGIALRWLHRDAAGAEPGTLLLAETRELPRASRPVQVFAHGERTAIKAIRRLLQDEWELEKSDMSLSAYWALGRAEDKFQEEKREPIGVIFDA